MKNHRLVKLFSLIFAIALLLGAVALTTFAENDPDTVDIAKKNIFFGDTFQLMFAVKAPENVKVTATSGGNDIGIEYIGKQTIGGTEYHVYKTVEGWAAQNINSTVTVTATAGNSTDKLTYSVLEYLYERINVDTGVPEKKLKMYKSLLQFAIDADAVINSEQGRTPHDLASYCYVSLQNATLDGYNTSGMFKKGDIPFSDISHTLSLSDGDEVEWTYSVNGKDMGVIKENDLKNLAVNGNITVNAGIYQEITVEKFLYFTDPHYVASGAEASWKSTADSHLNTMKSVYTASGAKFAMCGGDWLNDSNTRASALQMMAEIRQRMNATFGKAYLMIGNHDYNYQKISGGSTVQSEHELTPEEIASVWFSEYGKTYYSFKGDATTFYVFDSGKDWSHGRVNDLDREQIRWYIASLNATDDKHIAIASHMLYVNDVTWMMHPATEIIAEISNAYNNRLTYTFDGVTYDFGSKTGRVEFIIAGHTHLDEIGTFHGIPYIVTNASHSTGANGEPTFDIVTVDYETRVITTDRTGRGSDRTIYLDPCTQNHYETNASGHRVSESCEKCGLTPTASFSSHTAPEVRTIVENGMKRYDYVCTECEYVLFSRSGEFNTDVNYFSAPGQVYVRWEGGKPFEIKKEGDQIFTRAHLTHAYGSFCVSNRAGLVEKAYTAEWDEIKNGSGKYAVFKLRASGVTNLTFGLQSDNSLTDFPDSAFVSRYHSGGFDNWKIYVVDLSKMAAPAYSVDNKNVTNVVFGFRAASASANAYIDLEYFAICDNWEEIASVVGDQNVYYTNWRDPSSDVQRPSNGVCQGDHSIKLTVSGNNYTYACEFCNFKTEQTVSVGANSVNFFSAPGQQYNNYNVPNGSNASRHSTGTLKYDTVGGFVYNSLAFGGSGSMVFGDGSAVLNGMEDYTKNTVYGTGKYFVIKFRAQSQITEMKIGAYDGTNSKVIADKNAATAGSGTDAIYETNMRGGTVPTDWKVFVISIEDMLDKSVPFYTAGGTEQTTASFGFKIKNGSAYAGTVDIAYFAVCDNWAEIDSIVGNDSVVLTSWENTVADVTLSSADIDNKVIEEAK